MLHVIILSFSFYLFWHFEVYFILITSRPITLRACLRLAFFQNGQHQCDLWGEIGALTPMIVLATLTIQKKMNWTRLENRNPHNPTKWQKCKLHWKSCFVKYYSLRGFAFKGILETSYFSFLMLISVVFFCLLKNYIFEVNSFCFILKNEEWWFLKTLFRKLLHLNLLHWKISFWSSFFCLVMTNEEWGFLKTHFWNV